MKYNSILYPLVIIGFIIGFTTVTDGLAAPVVTARFDREVMYIGDVATFQIVVSGIAGGNVSASLINVTGLNFQSGGTSSNTSTSIVNGKWTTKQETILNYRVTASAPGNYTVPPVTVSVGNQKARTQPVAIKVSKPPEGQDMLLRVNVSKKQCYTGEPVSVVYRWYYAKSIKDYAFQSPLLDQIEELSLRVLPPESGKPAVEITINNRAVVASKSTDEVNGAAYSVINVGYVI